MLSIDIPFYENELKCNCGCGQAILQDELIHKLVSARWIAGIGFVISSWNRCPKYNNQVGGIKNSEHLRGYAVDIRIESSEVRYTILQAAILAGFQRIGLYSWGLHLGADPEKPQKVIWKGGYDG